MQLSHSPSSDTAKIKSFGFKWNSQFLLLATTFIVTALFTAFASVSPVERAARNISDTVNSKPASGQIHLIEIDAKSLQKLEKWPWPRSYHAQLVNRLTEAGVAQIVFDVDFSSRSDAAEDAVFAEAIARSQGKVVLPTFRQAASSDVTEEEVESLPIESLRENAILGSVNVRPDKNGHVNSYPYGIVTDHTPRPSIAAILADQDGSLNTTFKIDQSIEIDTIPKHSFVDILNREFDKNELKNKKVIVGATAIEIGDRYPTNRFGVVPGVVIQTMAAETLLAGTALPQLGPWPLIILCFMMLSFCIANFDKKPIALGAFTASTLAILLVIPTLSRRLKYAELDIIPAIMMVAIFFASRFVFSLYNKISVANGLDADTGLPNFATWKSHKLGSGLNTVVVAEISNFKEITSTLDDSNVINFVQNVAVRLGLSTAQNQIFRINREQFCWSVNSASKDEVENMLNAAAHLFTAPIIIGTRQLKATIAFGAVIGRSTKASDLSGKAALASKKASATGVRTLWHNKNMAEINDESVFIASEFADALATGQISVVYQPKFSVKANRVTGAEALIRWSHPVRGSISPSVFVPVLEKENLMKDLTLFVLREIAEETPKWNCGPASFGCAINVSATLLMNSDFAKEAVKIIKNSGIDPRTITIELTESAALSSMVHAEKILRRLKEFGFSLSIDDYGTGQSTLSYLRKFHADEIKIDKSFVRTINTEQANMIMVKSTIEMARELGVSVVAEGVEESAVYTCLVSLGCDVIQGWYIGKPISSHSFIRNWVNPVVKKQPQIKAA